MIDFAKMLEEHLARMSPEERAESDRRMAEHQALEDAIRPIASKWTWRTPNDPYDYKKGSRVVREEAREIGLRVEPVGTYGRDHEVLQFVGGPTGHEGYHLDDDFCTQLLRDSATAESDEWAICAGTPGRYPTCVVATADIIAMLDGERPDLMAEARNRLGLSAAPTCGM